MLKVYLLEILRQFQKGLNIIQTLVFISKGLLPFIPHCIAAAGPFRLPCEL